jgi:hypothetical protein
MGREWAMEGGSEQADGAIGSGEKPAESSVPSSPNRKRHSKAAHVTRIERRDKSNDGERSSTWHLASCRAHTGAARGHPV